MPDMHHGSNKIHSKSPSQTSVLAKKKTTRRLATQSGFGPAFLFDVMKTNTNLNETSLRGFFFRALLFVIRALLLAILLFVQ